VIFAGALLVMADSARDLRRQLQERRSGTTPATAMLERGIDTVLRHRS